mmetsp:Transcript_34167/g.98391  ORF Transcript_34167/g.98391 Transcript_34167/m.98391 type:complete len:214 (-) Transcript_34167:127-768(-)
MVGPVILACRVPKKLHRLEIVRVHASKLADARSDSLAHRMVRALALAPSHTRLPARGKLLRVAPVGVQLALVRCLLPGSPPSPLAQKPLNLLVAQEVWELDDPGVLTEDLRGKAWNGKYPLKCGVDRSRLQGLGHVGKVPAPRRHVTQVAGVAGPCADVNHERGVVFAPKAVICRRKGRASLMSIFAVPATFGAIGTGGPDLLLVAAVGPNAL